MHQPFNFLTIIKTNRILNCTLKHIYKYSVSVTLHLFEYFSNFWANETQQVVTLVTKIQCKFSKEAKYVKFWIGVERALEMQSVSPDFTVLFGNQAQFQT